MTVKAQTKNATGKTLVVVQTGSQNRKKPGMRETLLGLGLGRIHARRELQDTPAIRGMINKVRHLVRIVGK